MRRALSILLVLSFTMGPLAPAFAASDESSLPPCCRRHGAHHCAMAMRAAVQAASDKHRFAAPSRCPSFPRSPAASTASVHALAATPVSLPALAGQHRRTAAGRNRALLDQVRTRAGRGPPALRIG